MDDPSAPKELQNLVTEIPTWNTMINYIQSLDDERIKVVRRKKGRLRFADTISGYKCGPMVQQSNIVVQNVQLRFMVVSH